MTASSTHTKNPALGWDISASAKADKGEKIAFSSLAQETGAVLVPWPEAGAGAEGGLDCGSASCLYTVRGHRVVIVTGEAALPLKCGGVDAIVSQIPAGFRCRSMLPVIDRIDSWQRGAVALWLGADGITIESANESRGDRPWVPQPRPSRRRPIPAAADRNPAFSGSTN